MAWLWQRDIDDEKRKPRALVRLSGGIAHWGVRVRRAEKELRDLGFRKGWTVVDYGCGTGIYTFAAAAVVGESGTVHAVDLHPTTLEMVEKRSKSMGLGNVETIYSDIETGLGDQEADAVIVYDMLKSTKKVMELMREANRIVRDDGILLVRQSGMKEDRVKEMVLKDGFFSYNGRQGKTLRFSKIKGSFYEI